MDARMIEKLKDKLAEELEKVSRKSSMTAGDLDAIHKLIISIEKLMKIEEMEGGSGEGYSQRGNYSRTSYGGGNSQGNYSQGNYSRGGRSYEGEAYNDYDNNSYANRGMHYVRGHYSRAEGSGMIKEELRKMMDDNQISGQDRRTLEKAMEILEG